ncbi:hypothetical protein LSH36_218g02000 [Paralvinella palmiformis]|uniref:Uncharacterized protein n=1 Tax=Paralvinella palmiformis TaxID=53620 RepID=A0AAD9JN28_9ANNE|nr:hypothetical protein LSH36_218g02000 [Paralvinella palmiformis]
MAAAKDRELAAEEQLPMLGGKTTVVCATPGECPDMCELHEMRPCTICNSCSTYMSGQHGLTLGRDEGHYGRPTAAPTALLAANGQGLKLSPSKDAASNLPQAVRVPLSHGSPARAVTYQIQERIVRPLAAVDDRRMYAESPYGFPGSYFKTFVKPLGNPAVVPELGGSAGGADSGTSPDIVPEYCGQNSTNAAIARSVANQQRQVAANTPPSAANT